MTEQERTSKLRWKFEMECGFTVTPVDIVK